MKSIFTFLLACFISPLVSFGQKDSEFVFKMVDSVAGTKAELYVKAQSWLAARFKSSKTVIQMEDKDAGRIIGKANYPTEVKAAFGNVIGSDYVSFTITIDVKDGRYRCVLSDFTHEAGTYKYAVAGGSLNGEKPECGTFMMPKRRWAGIKQEIREDAAATLSSLKKEMASPKLKDDF